MPHREARRRLGQGDAGELPYNARHVPRPAPQAPDAHLVAATARAEADEIDKQEAHRVGDATVEEGFDLRGEEGGPAGWYHAPEKPAQPPTGGAVSTVANTRLPFFVVSFCAFAP